jgi:threonine dehydratase
MRAIDPISLDAIRAARERIAGSVLRTPLVRLNVEEGPGEIWLKLENLQPIGSFKLRGSGNAMRSAAPETLTRGVYTASAGNMAQGVAWNARLLGVPCTVVVPDNAPRTKLEAIERLGARIVKLPFDRWWQVLVEHNYPGIEGLFIHPVSNPAVIAGNGTIGLEILEDLPDVDRVIVPYGGGGLSCGIASAIRALRPSASVHASEVETAAPLAASLAAGKPETIDYKTSFVDGIGGRSVRLLSARNRVIAEGAGASSVAAAAARPAAGKTVCVVSGGNIDAAKLAAVFAGQIPG